MLNAFKKFIASENLFFSGDKILLGVSGGIDSVAMAELFDLAGYRYGIAHCNFKLRDEDSDRDEQFVKALAQQKGVEFFTKHFDTQTYADDKGLSIQMAARELRYDWFNDLITRNDYKYIATAHHKDDQIETFLINLIRGTGIAGLHGILAKYNRIIHPMMFTWRSDIERFVKEANLSYRTDISNLSTRYIRNKIRHQVLPVFQEINPEYRNSVGNTIERLREAETIFKETILKRWEEIKIQKEDKIYIPIKILHDLVPLHTYLFEFISPFGFNTDSVEQIINALSSQPGKLFYSPSHILVKDRDYLIIVEKELFDQKTDISVLIDKSAIEINNPVKLRFEKKKKDAGFQMPINPEIASLDFDKLKFPLNIRRWEQGDLFYPLGMTGKKKVSDYFIDQKFSLDQKNSVWLLVSGKDIVWIIGHRIDHRFRIGENTTTIYQIKHINKG